MTLNTKNTKWCYRQINTIPNLSHIQQELREYMFSIKPSTELWEATTMFMPKDKVYKQTPLFNEYLMSLGIFDRWAYSLLIYTNNGESLPIHIDSPPWNNERYALNIPVYNCESTYTVWYECDIDYDNSDIISTKVVNMTEYSNPDNPNKDIPARVIKNNSSYTEIDRLDSNQPAWVDYTIPHRPIANHNMPRALFSTRFRPDLSDIIDNL